MSGVSGLTGRSINPTSWPQPAQINPVRPRKIEARRLPRPQRTAHPRRNHAGRCAHRAVAHLHPPGVVAADLAGIALRPIYGAFDIPAPGLARDGVPVYERTVLIRNARLGRDIVAAMRGGPVVVLRGRGITSAPGTVEQAVLQAISVHALARLSQRVRGRRHPARHR